MRASRLLNILMVLQARGRVTAQELADTCEVSLRTIYRDIDALSAAEVPVYADRGSAGGYRLLEGYRTRLNGMSPAEAEAVFLSGLPGPAEALGLGATLANAQLKLLTALPPEMRSAAARVRTRFHLDAPGWFHSFETPEHLHKIVRAVWDDRMIEIRYRSWKAEKRRRLAPLGLVLKGGGWYLAGAVDGGVRTYYVGRIRELTLLDTRFERPDGFDLAAYWADSTRRLEAEMHQNSAMVRLSPTGQKMLRALLSPYMHAHLVLGAEDEQGHRIATIPVGSIWSAASELLRFGPELEVLEPPELRAHMASASRGLSRLYEEGSRPARPRLKQRG